MPKRSRAEYLRSTLLALSLLGIAYGYFFLHTHGLTGRHFVRALHHLLERAGPWGPVLVMILFALQTIVPIPNVILAALTGSFYGPYVGSAIVFTGWMLSASVSFAAGRYFGQPLLQAHRSGWIQRYQTLIETRGFMTVMFMRIVQFPSDVVGVLCGVTRVRYREYMLATFLGVLPGVITFTALGRSWRHPFAWVSFGGLFAVSVFLAFAVRKTKWFRSC